MTPYQLVLSLKTAQHAWLPNSGRWKQGVLHDKLATQLWSIQLRHKGLPTDGALVVAGVPSTHLRLNSLALQTLGIKLILIL